MNEENKKDENLSERKNSQKKVSDDKKTTRKGFNLNSKSTELRNTILKKFMFVQHCLSIY